MCVGGGREERNKRWKHKDLVALRTNFEKQSEIKILDPIPQT